MEQYQQKYLIVASDMDITYHMTPNAIMLYFQDCFARFLTSKHLAAFDIIKDDLIWIIYDLQVDFVKERPLWSSPMTVKISFTEISSVKIYVDYWLCDADDEVFAQGTSVWAIINQKTKRPFPAAEMLAKAGITAEGTHLKTDVVEDISNKQHLKDVEHLVNVTDLDFNGHVCNRTYLLISTATQPLEFIKKYTPRHLHIKFCREAFFGETLTIKVSNDGDEKYWYDIVNSKGKAICNIYSEWENNEEELSRNVSDMIDRSNV